MIDPVTAMGYELALCRIASGDPQTRRWAPEIAQDALAAEPCDCYDDDDDDELDPYAVDPRREERCERY